MRTNIIGTLAHRLALLAYVVFALFPLFWLLKVSVTPNKLLYSEGVRMWPSETTWEHYAFVLRHSAFPTFFMNSLIVAGSTAIVVTLCASLSGYALSRFSFRAKYWIVALMLLTQMFPLVMLVAPIFKILSPLGLTNSLTGLVIVYSAFNVPFATFLMQSFFDGIPRDLEEAAMIDGATQFVAFRQIILPLTLPGIAATLGFVFTAAWSELLFALDLRLEILGRFRADDGGRRARAHTGRSLFPAHPALSRPGPHRRRRERLVTWVPSRFTASARASARSPSSTMSISTSRTASSSSWSAPPAAASPRCSA
jgi:multiple sugar transport system permease protein